MKKTPAPAGEGGAGTAAGFAGPATPPACGRQHKPPAAAEGDTSEQARMLPVLSNGCCNCSTMDIEC